VIQRVLPLHKCADPTPAESVDPAKSAAPAESTTAIESMAEPLHFAASAAPIETS
jgi:hypothetical protein